MSYETIKSEIPPEIMSLCSEIKTAKEQLSNAQERRDEMQKDILELQGDIAKRKERAGSAFTGTREKTDNFLGRLRNDKMELSLKEDAVRDLETTFIPALSRTLAGHETNLKILADIFYMERLRLINDAIDKKAIEIFKMSDDFMQDFQQIYSDLGLALIFSREEMVPIRWWSSQEQQEQKIRVGLVGSKEPSREQVWANYHKTVGDIEPAGPLLDKPSVPIPSVPDEEPTPDFNLVPTPAKPLSDDSVWGLPADDETNEMDDDSER